MRISQYILCSLLISACSVVEPVNAEKTQAGAWYTDVIGINEMHLSADYWVDQTENAGETLKGRQAIREFNRRLYSTDPNMVVLSHYPEQLAGREVANTILAISKPNKSDLFSDSGEKLGPEGYREYTDNLGLSDIPGSVQIRFALVVDRSDMRTYPTAERYYKSQENQNLDRFQENGLFPGDALAVLHVSADKQWSFVQSYNYAAWVRSEHIAIGERGLIEKYKKAEHYLVITGDKVWTSFNPEVPAISELQLDMGVRVPLAERNDIKNNLYGQNPYASHTVLLPVRNNAGELEIRQALISRNRDVNKGYLPFTRENITRQAFKFLGERYGWGHSYNARDCTGFVMEIYKSFGIQMPRNTGQQGAGSFGDNTRFNPDSSLDEKLLALAKMDTGDLIYVPGHVLMYIGDVNGEPYVIHDVSVFRYTDKNGDYYEGVLNGVSVTPFIPLYGSRESKYIDLISNIKKIR